MRVTPVASPSPSLATTIFHSAVSPAESGPLPVFRTETSGQSTLMTTTPLRTSSSLEASAEPSFSTVPQVAAVVSEATCTDAFPSASRSNPVPPHVSVPAVMEQLHPPVVSASTIDQVRLASVGSTSVSSTSNAVPSPVLVTVTL